MQSKRYDPRPTLAVLALLAGPAMAQEAPPHETAATARAPGVLVGIARGQWSVALADPAHPVATGSTVSMYVAEERTDPRTGEKRTGLRYAGDGRVAWRGGDLAAILPVRSAAPVPPGTEIVLGEPLHLDAIEPWVEPDPPPPIVTTTAIPAAAPEPEVPVEAPRPRVEVDLLASLTTDPSGSPLGNVHDRYRARYGPIRYGIRAGAGWSDDGRGSGVGLGALTWRLYPDKGPAMVEVGLEGMRGSRWVAGGDEQAAALAEGEDYGREAAVGYWLWSRTASPGVGAAVLGGVGFGVDIEGLALGWMVGVRTGDPTTDAVTARYVNRGRLGGRLALDGHLAVADGLRIGARTRIGDLPRHQGDDFDQARADGALLVSADLSERVTVDLAAGLAGYDLLFQDTGPLADLSVEYRW